MTDPDRCPKRMHYGPCGGVRPDLTCEMASFPCPFAQGQQAVSWSGPAPQPIVEIPLFTAARERPVVLTDFSITPFTPASIVSVAETLAGSCDGLLVGEHQNRPDFPPTLMTKLIRDAGGSPWITLTCRDRNRVVLEQELAGLTVAGAAGVLCVTGDGRAHGEGFLELSVDAEPFKGRGLAAGLNAPDKKSSRARPPGLHGKGLRSRRWVG